MITSYFNSSAYGVAKFKVLSLIMKLTNTIRTHIICNIYSHINGTNQSGLNSIPFESQSKRDAWPQFQKIYTFK